MELAEFDLNKYIPEFMREDDFDSAFATGMSNQFTKFGTDMERVVIIGQEDYLNEAELDQLATDWNVFWYSYSANISVKRKLIKNAPLVFKRLGTVWAVEKVLNDYLTGCELQEWFEYSGNPHHFRIITLNTEILQSDIQTFLAILERVKRKSQWLENIILILRACGTFYPGMGIFERSFDTITFE